MSTTPIKTQYPCCKSPARFKRTAGAPIEKYDRTCPWCGQAWTITADIIPAPEGLRYDRLEWEHA